jgi:hypothetical protein
MPTADRFAAAPRPRVLALAREWWFLNTCEGTTHHGSEEDNMATTATSIPNPPITYALLVIFTVDPRTHAHLHDQQLIREQAQSWLTSLDATVHGVNVRKAG